jgi:hypothetical protein
MTWSQQDSDAGSSFVTFSDLVPMLIAGLCCGVHHMHPMHLCLPLAGSEQEPMGHHLCVLCTSQALGAECHLLVSSSGCRAARSTAPVQC